MDKKEYVLVFLFLMTFMVVGNPAFARDRDITYEVTITNLTRGQIFSPPIVISHNRDFELFTLGEPASPELAALAEDGMTGPLIDLLAQTSHANYAVADGPVPPGGTITITITTQKWLRLLSLGGMLVTTNDGFFAIKDLYAPFRGEVTMEADAYDAGSERNSEDCAFIPGPPCGNGGVHDPADAEGYVHIHAGIHGIGPDPEMVDPAMHDWRNPVAKITVRRIQ